MTDELLSTLYNRHAAALSVVAAGADQRVHIDAALMALALMARELADKLPDIHQANGGSGEKRVDLRTYEWLNDQIARINDWLAENEVGLYQDPHTDTADAIIAAASGTRAGLASALAENRRLQEQLNRAVNAEDASINAVIGRQVEQLLEQYASDLHDRLLSGEFTTVDQALAVQLERNDRTLKSVIDLRDKERVRRHNAEHRIVELDAENARLRQIEARLREELADANRRAAVITGNGKSQPAAVLMHALDDAPGLDWSSLSQAAQDYRIGLDAGRWKWRDIPKSTRLELVRCVIRNAGHMPTQGQFDAVRPSWMATADAQKAAFGVQWGILANLDREIEVAP